MDKVGCGAAAVLAPAEDRYGRNNHFLLHSTHHFFWAWTCAGRWLFLYIFDQTPTTWWECQVRTGCWWTPTYLDISEWTMILETGIVSSPSSKPAIRWITGSGLIIAPLLLLSACVNLSFPSGFTNPQQSADHWWCIQPSTVKTESI